MAFQTVLCPVDFSGPSRTALRHAAALAKGTGTTLVVLYVADPVLNAAAHAAAFDVKALTAATAADLEKFASDALGGRRLPPRRFRALVREGRPATEIVKAAARVRADVIVMGTQGLTGARRLVLGSTTESVIRAATVPVLAVPPAAGRLLRRRRPRR